MSLYPISDIKYHSEFQKSRVQNLSCEMICIGSTRMRLLFVSAPFRGYPRTLTRFRREPLGILETALYEYHIHELSEWIGCNTHYQCGIWWCLEVSLVFLDAKQKPHLEDYHHYPTKCGDSCEKRCSTIHTESTVWVNNTTCRGD